MAAIVVVFDFDRTIIDCDSDDWVVDRLGLTDVFEQLLPTLRWNSLMDRMMGELHTRGRSVEEIADCLRTLPLDSHIIDAIKTAYALGCELRMVSDANMFFIETILKHHGLLECFSEINTNPSFADEQGRLRILPYHEPAACAYGCGSLCSLTMCKGAIVDRIRASAAFAQEKKQIIYVGDGKGDYCPSLRLTQGDHVMPRKNYPLWNLIRGSAELLKAEVHEWSSGEELGKVLLELINTSNDVHLTSASQLFPVDCKHESVPGSAAPAALPLPLRVPR